MNDIASSRRMTIVISKNSIKTFVILLFVYKVMYLIQLPGTYGLRTNMVLPMIFSDVFFIGLYLSDKWTLSTAQFSKFLIFFYLFITLEVIYTLIAYTDEGIYATLAEASTYTLLLAYYLFLKSCKENLYKFINAIVICGTIIALLFVAQALIYNANGTKILKILGFSYGTIQIVIRNSHIRLIAVDLVSFSSILSIGLLCSQDIELVGKKARYVLNIIAILLYEIYCTRTRSTVLMIIFVLLLTVMFSTKKNSLRKMAIFLLIIAGIAVYWTEIYAFFSGMYNSLLQRTDWSIYHRFDSYLYYLSVIGKKPIFGNGLLRDTPSNSTYYHVVHGPQTYPFGYSDVGLIGTGAKLGIIGIALYVYLIVKSFKNVKVNGKIDSLNLAIAVCMVVSTINLSMFDAERLIVLAVFMAIEDARINMYELNSNGMIEPGEA